MSWEQYRSIMERYAIKTDDMATEDAYFLATHMPFAQLEVYLGGRTSSSPKLFSEDEVFDNLVCNPNNDHRMIIVRGDNGTGKSHLIRYLKAKMQNSPSTIYNPDKEQLIFLRRLNNSVRGVFQQLVDQKVIKDPDVEAKLIKFINSSDSKDEAAFKTDILFAYVAAVSNDVSGEMYKAVECRDIASYLSDSRVREYLLREDGAIARCYNVITAPSNQVLKDTTVFSVDDFLDKRGKTSIIREVKKQGDPQASDFATTLLEDDSEITKLVNYLNRFTREVIQRCADISSESTKSVFEQLRKDLKRQGKNLTLFIEDFTGFTGIDSELITVLSTEHGGDYADLCRVTSIIGITNDYYDQFRDNFTDRVTHQISVTDRSYGTNDFLIQMAGRYLNAIYCDPEVLRQWERNGADTDELPISTFTPPCKWETVKIGDNEATLYPFNSHALLSLYECLVAKSPRTFLKEVIRAQLKEYFDGKTFGDEWDFPLNPKNVQMSKGEHSSAIDRIASLSKSEKTRLQSVLALWGDGTAYAQQNGSETLIGSVDSLFLQDIGLSNFKGFDGNGAAVPTEPGPEPEPNPTTEPIPVPVDKARQEYDRFKKDITAWYNGNALLQYHADYRKMLQAFICGNSGQCGAINWQDLGIPAFVAAERLNDSSFFYIEGQDNDSDSDKALVRMDRSSESRDALQALIELRYARGWNFEGTVYYQQRLITWLERNKASIIERVVSAPKVEEQLPITDWCLALQYLRAMILGKKIDSSSPITVIKDLFSPINKDEKIKRETKEWNDLIQFVMSHNAEFDGALTMLQKASATTMGAIQGSRDTNDKRFYRGDELIKSAEHLISLNWDIESELPKSSPDKHLLFNPANLLKSLYPKIKQVMDAEKAQSEIVITKLKGYFGELTKDNLTSSLSAVQNLFSVFSANGIIGSSELRSKFEKAPIENATEVMKIVGVLTDNGLDASIKQLTAFSGNALHALSDFLRDIQQIAHLAEQEEEKAKKELAKIGTFTGMEEITELARASMDELCTQLENMEVYDNVAN